MKGIVYCIKEISTGEIIYVGSSKMSLSKRKWYHLNHCFNKLVNTKLYNYLRSITDKNGFDTLFTFEELYNAQVNDIKELHKLERGYFEKYKPSLNAIKPYRTEKEKYEYKHRDRSEDRKQYYSDNSESIKEKAKQYYQENHDLVITRCRESRQRHRESYNAYMREYRKKKKIGKP